MRRLIVSTLAAAATACTPSPTEKAGEAARSVVVLSIWEGPEGPAPPIQGSVACPAPAPLTPPCLQDDKWLAEAALQCGSLEVTIDRSFSHVRYVYFPAGLHAQHESIPPDLEIVRCVRGRVGFRFAAGVARDRNMLVEADQRPFEALHAPNR